MTPCVSSGVLNTAIWQSSEIDIKTYCEVIYKRLTINCLMAVGKEVVFIGITIIFSKKRGVSFINKQYLQQFDVSEISRKETEELVKDIIDND